MRQPFIAGNWKMNLSRADCQVLAEELAKDLATGVACDVAICPPFVYLETVRTALGESPIGLGAQNMFPEPAGAFTGEISPTMLLDLGCQYVILGHSERRHILGETDKQVFIKTCSAIAAGLKPIVCLGETLEDRRSERTAAIIRSQFEGSLAGLEETQFQQVTIAYEPVWAIGTGVHATPEQAGATIGVIRRIVADLYDETASGAVRILYGGSVNTNNWKELASIKDIDGALVGGASLSSEDFLRLVAISASL